MQRNVLFFSLFLLLLWGNALAASESRLLYEIAIPFEENGEVAAHLPDGRAFSLGRVVKLPEKTRWPSYTASAWGKPGSVTASAVNAVHILMGIEEGKGRTMSVIPQETIAPAAGPGAAIVLDAKAGTAFFGAWAPPVGTRILLAQHDSSEKHPLENRLPQPGDTMIFQVYEEMLPYMIEIENKSTGRVTSWSKDGVEVIARVIRPVGGVGRFGGTVFQDAGRIRANHSGVIDVSTCEYGQTGGFQIIPWDHALTSKEMQGAWSATQWLIIGPADGKSMMGGTYPLFSGGLIPGPLEREQLWDLWSTYGRKPLVLARRDGGEWAKFPQASGKVDDAFKDVTHIRIYFPFTDEPLKEPSSR